jgi:hypothetical protein
MALKGWMMTSHIGESDLNSIYQFKCQYLLETYSQAHPTIMFNQIYEHYSAQSTQKVYPLNILFHWPELLGKLQIKLIRIYSFLANFVHNASKISSLWWRIILFYKVDKLHYKLKHFSITKFLRDFSFKKWYWKLCGFFPIQR